MKINHKILSIPPYISTSWKNVLSLHLTQTDQKTLLSIVLLNGATIEIPNLEPPILEAIFAAHEKFMDHDQTPPAAKNFAPPLANSPLLTNSSLIGFPIKLGVEGIENFGSMLQHNPETANSPDLPKDVLEKITTLSKVVGFDSSNSLPKAEPHCNCLHCQIMRALHGQSQQDLSQEHSQDEVVSDEDLKFRDWDIEQTAEKLYLVKNPLNHEEHYNVFLGNPMGCTCGQKSCEHIRAVLNT